MTDANEKNYLADAFSARLARDFPKTVWQSQFGEGSAASRMHAATWSVVCAESPWDGRMSQAEVRIALARLAAGRAGHLDAGPCSASLAAFAAPDAALRAALALQRSTAAARLRIGVLTVRAGVAHFRFEGATVCLLVGASLDGAAALLRRAVPGTVQLCADTYDALAGVSPELDACLVMPGYDRDELTHVALTPAPARGEFRSNFASLGLA
ncbi:MAG: response regulator [Ramlibacter sp.]|nr:response regulator [Ramlibacter sp.]